MALREYTKIEVDQKEFWARWWKNHDANELIRGMKYSDEYPYCIKYLEKDMKVLDAGCGLGQYVISLSTQGYNVMGMDFSLELLFRIKKSFKNTRVIGGDTQFLPVKNESFNTVLSFGVVEHFEEGPQRALNEFHRILDNNGIMILSVPYCNILRKLRYPLRSFGPVSVSSRITDPSNDFYQYLYLKKEVISFVESAGFSIVECKRAYYQTLLFRSTSICKIRDLIFKTKKKQNISRGEVQAPPGNKQNSSQEDSGIKRMLKKIISGALNLIMPHFLILVCRKK